MLSVFSILSLLASSSKNSLRYLFISFFTLVIFMGLPTPILGQDWYHINVDNFTIYYTKDHHAFAKHIATIAPDVYRSVTPFFEVYPGHCNVVIHPNVDSLNGYVTPLPKSIHLFPMAYDNFIYFNSTHTDINKLVFIHEFTHFIQFSVPGTLLSQLKPILGAGIISPNAFAPHWFLEGLAVFIESLDKTGRGKGDIYESQFRDLLRTHPFITFSQASNRVPDVFPSNRGYLFGYFVVKYIYDTHGKEGLQFLLKNYPEEFPFTNFYSLLETLSGHSTELFYKNVLLHYYNLFNMNETLTSSGNDTIVYSQPNAPISYYTWKNNRTLLAFKPTSEKASRFIEIDTTHMGIKESESTSYLSPKTPFYLINNDIILSSTFFNDALGQEHSKYSDLFLYNIHSRKFKRLTHQQHLFEPHYSPLTKQIIAVKNHNLTSELAVYDLSGKHLETLYVTKNAALRSPRFSPDGNTIVLSIKESNGMQLWRYSLRTKTMSRLLPNASFSQFTPSFSADGHWLFFSGKDQKGIQLYAFQWASKSLFKINTSSFSDYYPQLSPDGKTLAYCRPKLAGFPGGYSIHKRPFNPSQLIRVALSQKTRSTPKSIASTPRPSSLNEIRGLPLTDYWPLLHIPLLSENTFGAFLFGSDPVGLLTYEAMMLTNPVGLPSARLLLAQNTKNFYSLTALHYNSPISLSDFTKHSIKETISYPITHTHFPDKKISLFSVSGELIQFLFDGVPETDLSYILGGKYKHSILQISSYNDVFNPYKTTFSVSAKLGQSSSLSIHQLFLSSTIQYPTFIDTHGIEIGVHYLRRNTLLTPFPSETAPIGYTLKEDNIREMISIKNSYKLPLIRYDKGLLYPFSMHINTLYGSLFTDLSYFPQNSSIYLASSGITLKSDIYLFNILPLDVGIALGLLWDDQTHFIELLFNTPI